jgi:hypothetical protein
MVGALLGSVAGLAWCKPDDRHQVGRGVAHLANFLVGGLVGFAVWMSGFSSQLRYEGERIVFAGEERRVEAPRDPNGYLCVSLFGHPVYEEVGPREEMKVWHRRLDWFILSAFITGGASVGVLLGLLMRRRTSHCSGPGRHDGVSSREVPPAGPAH